jgi:predicted dehydrogenase
MALGILYEAMARWLGRATDVTAVTAFGSTPRPSPEGPLVADVAEHVLAVLAFPDEVTATVEMSTRTNGADPNSVTFYGTDGTLRVDLTAGTIAQTPLGGSLAPISIRDEDRAEWSAEIDFVAAIRGERPVTLTDFETGAHYMAVLEAIDRSAADGCRVAVPTVS